MIEFSVPLAPMAKARPRVTRNGTYMPPAYVVWKLDFGAACAGVVGIDGPFELHVQFTTATGKMRPDLDNALGAVLDAMQEAGVIANDRHCRALSAWLKKGASASIEIQLGEVRG